MKVYRSRIRLSFSTGSSVVISPRQQEDFFAEIKKVNPQVRIDC